MVGTRSNPRPHVDMSQDAVGAFKITDSIRENVCSACSHKKRSATRRGSGGSKQQKTQETPLTKNTPPNNHKEPLKTSIKKEANTTSMKKEEDIIFRLQSSLQSLTHRRDTGSGVKEDARVGHLAKLSTTKGVQMINKNTKGKK